MRRIVLATAILFAAQAASSATWTLINIQVEPGNSAKITAAADKLMNSAVGKEFPGQLLLQANVANGASPATHSFVPIYESAADQEAWLAKLQASPAWAEYQATTSGVTQGVSDVLHRTVKSWGDIVDTDVVWAAHAFNVTDPAGFMAAIDTLTNSETGKNFPGQAHLSAVVAGGISPANYVLSVGYASLAEMETWTQTIQPSADWAAYIKATQPTGEFLGTTLSRNIKRWGPAGLEELTD